MKKPEKKDIHICECMGGRECICEQLARIYNQCWDDREKWLEAFLPDEKEIFYILVRSGWRNATKKAKDIYKRLGGREDKE